MRLRVLLAAALTAGLLIGASAARAQTVIYVDADATGGSNGTSWATKTISFVNESAPADFKFRFVHGSDGVEEVHGAYIRNVELTLQ